MSHREKERTEDYKTKQWKARRHRRYIEQRSLFANSISNLYTKHLSQTTSQESVRYPSVTLCAVGTSVILRYLRPLRDSVCLLYKTFSFSLHISKKTLITLLPCLPLPCTMSLITLYHVFHYSVTMSLITLSHVSHYPVTMSLITLSPSRNAKPQKKS